MQTTAETSDLDKRLHRVANVLKIAGWSGVWIQLALAAASGLMVVFALFGRTFNQAIAVQPGIIGQPGTTPGLGVSTFLAIAGVILLLLNAFLSYRQTYYAKRLRHPIEAAHPRKSDIMQVVQLGVVVALVGMLLTILGSSTALAVLLSKVITQPQGVAIYDPSRAVRSLDVFVAIANMSGVVAHFFGTVAALSLLRWLWAEHQ